MAEKPTPTPDPSDAAAPVPAAAPAAPRPARTVTVRVLPFAIVGGVLIALLFFGGGVATGFALGDHHPMRVGVIEPFKNGRTGPFGGQNGFGQRGAQPGERPGSRPGGQNGVQNGGQQGTQPAPAPSPTNG